MKTAILIGATGLTGEQLLEKLLADKEFSLVKAFVRSSSGLTHSKLEEIKIGFERINDYKHLVKGDVLFSALGTTIKKAGSKEQFYKIDFEYNYAFAKAASENGVSKFVLVSSLGAKSLSSNFYLKTKGQLEEAVHALKFKSIYILRPSMLLGSRKEFRLAEMTGKKIMRLLNFLFVGRLKKYKAIDSNIVAGAMLILGKKNSEGFNVLESDQIVDLVKKNKL